MDYCTLIQVLGIIGDGRDPTPRPSPVPYDDTVISDAITAASRAIDHEVTGDGTASCGDYFVNSTITNDVLPGNVNKDGDIIAYLHKPNCAAPLASISYRWRGDQPWTVINPSLVTVDDYMITAWLALYNRGPVMIQATYTGGLGAAQANLPYDIQRAAAVLAGRYYKEGKGGLSDAIGIADVGTLLYTKAMPREVVELLDPYRRPVPW